MPIYRHNSLLPEKWALIKNIYRFDSSIANKWRKIAKIYRFNSLTAQKWHLIFTGQLAPEITTAPILTNQLSSYNNFYGTDVLTLTRGSYTNTTTNSNTTYRMTIYKSINSGTALTNWTVASRTTFTGANSTGSTSITYTITNQDAKDGYYFAAEVRVNNDANTVGSSNYDFETAVPPSGIQRILSRVFFQTNSFTVDRKSTSATFSWTVSDIADASFMYQDAANSASVVRITTTPGGAFVYDAPASVNSLSAGTATVPVGTLTANTAYRADLIVRGNDGWKTDVNFTKNNKGAQTLGSTYLTFLTPAAEPVNTVAPVVSPLNNRSRWPVNTLLSITNGTWSNLVSPTFTYKWEYFTSSWIPNSIVQTSTFPTSANGLSARCIVRATNSDGGFGEVTVNTTLDPEVIISGLSPTTVESGIATNFGFTINGYPTAYAVDWTNDGTNDFNQSSVTANTASVTPSVPNTYSVGGNYNLKVTAQPGNKVLTTPVTVTPQAFGYSVYEQSDVPARTALSQAKVAGSSNTVLIEFGSTTPADVLYDDLYIYGTGSQSFNLNTATVISAVTTSGITYYTTSANHGYQVDAKVTITGLTNYNVTEGTILPGANTNVFSVVTGAANGSISGQSGQAKASPVVSITTLNQYDSTGAFGSGTYEYTTQINSTASNSPISFFVKTFGTKRFIYVNTTKTTGASSWQISASWDFASTNSVTSFNNGVATLNGAASGTVILNTNSMPVKIFEITGTNNPTITINSVTAYSGASITGTTKAGTPGTIQLLGVPRPTKLSGVSTANYTYISPPSPFVHTLLNTSSVTTPSTPTQTRISSTSNTLLIDWASSKPADTESYTLNTYGLGSQTGGTLANPSTSVWPTVNNYDANGNASVSGPYDAITNISSSAINSPISNYVMSTGVNRQLTASVSTTTGAQSWRVFYTIAGAAAGNGTFQLNTNSMPAVIATIPGATNPTVTITGVTAYNDLNQQGQATAGTPGTPTSISGISKPIAYSGTVTNNWTYYTPPVTNYTFAFGKKISVSTNGYISLGDTVSVTANTADAVTATSGLVFAVLPRDMQQTALYYWSDTSKYVVKWIGYQYNTPANVMEYEVTFYNNQQYADMMIVQRFVVQDNSFAFVNNGSAITSYPSAPITNSKYRVYFNTTAPATIATYSPLSTTVMLRDTTSDTLDVAQTTLTTATNQQASVAPFFPFFPPFFPYFPYFPTFGGTAPATPTAVGLTGTGLVTWTHAGAGTFTIEFFTAGDGGGTGALGPYTQSTTTNGSYQLTTPYGGTGANWARVRVRANTGGLSSAYSAWVPSETSYT